MGKILLLFSSKFLVFLCFLYSFPFVYLATLAEPRLLSVEDQYVSVWNNGGMLLTGDNRITRRKTCPSATPAIKNPTCSMLGSKSGPCITNPVTNCLSYGMAYLQSTNTSLIMNYKINNFTHIFTQA